MILFSFFTYKRSFFTLLMLWIILNFANSILPLYISTTKTDYYGKDELLFSSDLTFISIKLM